MVIPFFFGLPASISWDYLALSPNFAQYLEVPAGVHVAAYAGALQPDRDTAGSGSVRRAAHDPVDVRFGSEAEVSAPLELVW
jgi:hypothetical protein